MMKMDFVQVGFFKLRSIHQYVSDFENSRCAKLVGLGGFEPPTSPLSGVRSNQLSYRPGVRMIIFKADNTLDVFPGIFD